MSHSPDVRRITKADTATKAPPPASLEAGLAGSLFVVTLADNSTTTVDFAGGEFQRGWPDPAPVWSPAGTQVAVVDQYGSVGVFDAASGARGVASGSTTRSKQPAPNASRRISTWVQEGSALSPDRTMEAIANFDEQRTLQMQICPIAGGTVVPVDALGAGAVHLVA